LAPGALLFLVLPFAPRTFDRGRPPATAQELLWLHADETAATAEPTGAPLAGDAAQVVSEEDDALSKCRDNGAEAAAALAAEARRTERAWRFVDGFPTGPRMGLNGDGHAGDAEPYGLAAVPKSRSNSSGSDGAFLAARHRALRRAIFKRCPTTTLAAVMGVNGSEAQERLAAAELACRKKHSKAAANDADADDAGASPWRVDESEVHWHVFDFNLLLELVEGCLGYRVRLADFQAPFHQIFVAQKPGAG